VSGLSASQAFNVDGNLAENWRLFKQKLHNYAIITNLSQQERDYHVPLFLHTIGDEALKVYNGFKFHTQTLYRNLKFLQLGKLMKPMNDMFSIDVTSRKVKALKHF